MKKTFILLLLLCMFIKDVLPQTGGNNVYEFLNLTHSGLVTSIGGSNVSLYGNDLNLSYHNPSLLNADMNKSMALNYVNYFAGINFGLAMYSRSFRNAGNFAAGLTYLNYGTFTEADPSGNITGSFGAAEYALSLIWSKSIDSLFTLGINFKPVLSQLEKYSSFGFAFDIGASWHNPGNTLSAGMVIRNAGLQVTSYAGEAKQKLPFEIQAGLTYRLAYAPLRFSLTARHLEKFDLSYKYHETGITETNSNASSGFFDNLLRHAVIGGELIPHKNFYLSAGYNFQRSKELMTESKGSMAGFTWGFGINTSWMDIELGRAVYHIAGSSTHISLILRPDNIYRKHRD